MQTGNVCLLLKLVNLGITLAEALLNYIPVFWFSSVSSHLYLEMFFAVNILT